MPTFAFPTAPAKLAFHLHSCWNAPLPLVLLQVHSFGTVLYARSLSTPNRSTSELLRTL